jgi:hypothetical protein
MEKNKNDSKMSIKTSSKHPSKLNVDDFEDMS